MSNKEKRQEWSAVLMLLAIALPIVVSLAYGFYTGEIKFRWNKYEGCMEYCSESEE
jgi:ABC-type spermidine/putrescine transport system permease subunit II